MTKDKRSFNKNTATKKQLLMIIRMIAKNILVRDNRGRGYYRDSLAIAFMDGAELTELSDAKDQPSGYFRITLQVNNVK